MCIYMRKSYFPPLAKGGLGGVDPAQPIPWQADGGWALQEPITWQANGRWPQRNQFHGRRTGGVAPAQPITWQAIGGWPLRNNFLGRRTGGGPDATNYWVRGRGIRGGGPGATNRKAPRTGFSGRMAYPRSVASACEEAGATSLAHRVGRREEFLTSNKQGVNNKRWTPTWSPTTSVTPSGRAQGGQDM